MAEALDYKAIGTRPIRPDGVDKVTGRANFGADFSLPGMIHGRILRSPHAHALIKSVDLSAALAMDGVFAAVAGGDFPEPPAPREIGDLARNIMARDKVLYHGHAVAAVAAATPQLAEQALAAIRVDYEVLTPVLDLDAAMAPDAPLLDDQCFTQNLPETPDKPSNVAAFVQFVRGDLDEGFAQAEEIVELECRIPMAHQGYIEPHACVGNVGEDKRASVWTCTQGHFQIREQTAKIVGMNIGDVRVTASEIGGGFGGKTLVYLEPVAVLLSMKARRPVKLTMSREEVFRATGPSSASHCTVRVGALRDGTIVAADAQLRYEAGAFAGAPVTPGAMSMFAPYNIANFRVQGFDVRVNKPKVAAYRAPGAPQSMHAMESAIDELARRLSMDPIDLRLHNAVEEGSKAAYGPTFPRYRLQGMSRSRQGSPELSETGTGGGRPRRSRRFLV